MRIIVQEKDIFTAIRPYKIVRLQVRRIFGHEEKFIKFRIFTKVPLRTSTGKQTLGKLITLDILSH